MAAERRTAAQAEQQQGVLNYVADGGCDVVGLEDMRLGDVAAEMSRMARGVTGRTSDEQRRRHSVGLSEEQRAAVMTQRRNATKVQWDSAGSHRDENGIWHAAGSYGEVEARASRSILDCRGWGPTTHGGHTPPRRNLVCWWFA